MTGWRISPGAKGVGTGIRKQKRNGRKARPASTPGKILNLAARLDAVSGSFQFRSAKLGRSILGGQRKSGIKAPPFLYPSVDAFGTVRWPSRDEVERLLVPA